MFRLGKMIGKEVQEREGKGREGCDLLYSAGAKGPGRVLVFPWLDRCIKAVVSDSAFSVPPQQLITNDGGIIEIGAEVQVGSHWFLLNYITALSLVQMLP